MLQSMINKADQFGGGTSLSMREESDSYSINEADPEEEAIPLMTPSLDTEH